MLTTRLRSLPALVALLALGLMASVAAPARAGDDSKQEAVDRAHDFLTTKGRGSDILSYVHFGAQYQGHKFQENRRVKDGDGKIIPGHFALVYQFKWEDDGWTDVAFLCDAKGTFYKVEIIDTNAVLSQPFALANLSIKVLGNLIIEALGDDLTAAQKKEVQKLVDDADAKALLELSLNFQQTLSR